jgi:hypothetical protein
MAVAVAASVGSTEICWVRRAQQERKVMGGLAGLVRGIAIGSVPLVIASCAAVFRALLAPAVADWCSATAAVEAIHRPNQTPSREEALAQIKAYRARLDSEPDTGDRRFQELVSGQPEAGRDRVH